MTNPGFFQQGLVVPQNKMISDFYISENTDHKVTIKENLALGNLLDGNGDGGASSLKSRNFLVGGVCPSNHMVL